MSQLGLLWVPTATVAGTVERQMRGGGPGYPVGRHRTACQIVGQKRR